MEAAMFGTWWMFGGGIINHPRMGKAHRDSQIFTDSPSLFLNIFSPAFDQMWAILAACRLLPVGVPPDFDGIVEAHVGR